MILADPWATLVSQTALAAAMVCVNSVWLGIAESAAATAHTSVRAEARRSVGISPPSALRFAELLEVLGQARAVLASTTDHVMEVGFGQEIAENLPLALELRNLKLSMTTLCADVVLRALGVIGLSGYKRGSQFSVERNVRDVLGGQLMANNNRFYVDNAQVLLMARQV